MNLILVAIFVFLLNLPFGYWRANVKKNSFQWVLAIHIPVPFIIAARIFSDIGFELYTYLILVGAFFLGQFIGRLFYIRRKKTGQSPLTSCLVMDLVRNN
ncbi:MAG: hypothetical protein EHM44_07405 [Ignavibacteriales bacterium]|nr:MAG: hypothetical protein EHM44_07405 [Ignavibacteriales bacterium]